MGLERLWADWRSAYVSGGGAGTTSGDGCVMCNLANAADDAEALVLERTPETITVMNLYPYGSGHLMVAPVRHVPALDDLSDAENVAIARAQVRAIRAIRATYHARRPQPRCQPRAGRGRRDTRASARARPAPVER